MKTMPFKFFSATFILTAAFIASCSSGPKEVEKTTFLETRTINAEDTLDKFSRREGDAHGGKFFSHTDSSNAYGMGIILSINDSLIGKDIRVYYDAWVRSTDPMAKQSMAVALHDGDNVIHWGEFEIKNSVKEANKWVNVKDSLTIPGTLITKPGLILKSFPFNPSKTASMDVDDIVITLKKVEKITVE